MLILNATRLCEKNAEILKAERLASKLCNNNFKNFWKDMKHMNNARLLNPSNVGGASGGFITTSPYLTLYLVLQPTSTSMNTVAMYSLMFK